MTAYRSAPTAPQAAPKTPWWRRAIAVAQGLTRRLAERERRLFIARHYPYATWPERTEAAHLLADVLGKTGSQREHAVLNFRNHLDTMTGFDPDKMAWPEGDPAMAFPSPEQADAVLPPYLKRKGAPRPPPPPTPIPGPGRVVSE